MTGPNRRPLIVVPARFAATTSALRFRAEVNAGKLIEAVYQAGGEPLSVHPSCDALTVDDIENRFGYIDGLLLPGGGDLDPRFYGGADHEALYDVDSEQDRFDLALAEWALVTGRPVLAICRGMEVANVHLGGSIAAHMDEPHRHVVSEVDIEPRSDLAQLVGTTNLSISCYHHQCLDTLGRGLRVVARGRDGTIEAVELDRPGWFVGVQWHPEDTADSDPYQARIFRGLVVAAGNRTGGRD